jgi:uncharacterized protein (DUF952 family)
VAIAGQAAMIGGRFQSVNAEQYWQSIGLEEQTLQTSGVKPGHLTYHLVAQDVWREQASGQYYLPEAFGQDGFVHCTDDLETLIDVGNHYYRHDRRDYCCLLITCDALEHEARYDDDDRMFPHIYGPIPTGAVVEIYDVSRDDDGQFLTIVMRST